MVVREHWGKEGPGLDVDFNQIEQIAIAAAQGLTAGALEAATAQQAEALCTQAGCPKCGQVCPLIH